METIYQILFLLIVVSMFVGLAGMTYLALAPLRLLLRLGLLQGGVDVLVSMVFTVFLFLMLFSYLNLRGTISWVAALALPVFLAGLLFLGVGLFEAPRSALGGERRDRLFLGTALMGTGFVMVYLGVEPYQGLFSDSASSVSNAPGP